MMPPGGGGNVMTRQFNEVMINLGVQQLLDELGNSAPALIGRGTAYALSGKIKEAIEDYSLACELDPKMVDAWRRRAQARAAIGEVDGAIEDCTTTPSLEIGADGPAGCAIEDFTTALSLEKGQMDLLMERGMVYARARRFYEAAKDLRAVVAVMPKEELAHVALRIVAGSPGNTGRCVHLRPPPSLHRLQAESTCALFAPPSLPSLHSCFAPMLQAESLVGLGETEEAMEIYEKAESLVGLGETEEAMEIYEKVVDANPGNRMAWLYMGQAAKELAMPDRAEQAYRKATQLEPRQQNRATGWHGCTVYMGQAAKELAMPERAEQAYRKATQLEPRFAQAYRVGALLKHAMGDHKHALELVQVAMQLEPEGKLNGDFSNTFPLPILPRPFLSPSPSFPAPSFPPPHPSPPLPFPSPSFPAPSFPPPHPSPPLLSPSPSFPAPFPPSPSFPAPSFPPPHPSPPLPSPSPSLLTQARTRAGACGNAARAGERGGALHQGVVPPRPGAAAGRRALHQGVVPHALGQLQDACLAFPPPRPPPHSFLSHHQVVTTYDALLSKPTLQAGYHPNEAPSRTLSRLSHHQVTTYDALLSKPTRQEEQPLLFMAFYQTKKWPTKPTRQVEQPLLFMAFYQRDVALLTASRLNKPLVSLILSTPCFCHSLHTSSPPPSPSHPLPPTLSLPPLSPHPLPPTLSLPPSLSCTEGGGAVHSVSPQ
ncbi:unnamed protein product [Closterium sp. NIES-65]|nr:unnamed protein product [Closterium sp. NIES-65]